VEACVKFYKRFPGDIQIKTGGLTLSEFGAYDRLLDHYYATEAPIEPGEVYSITRALTKQDREAVDKVLRRFFTVDADGNYSQQRADEMIAEAQPKIEAARRNGVKGGRPKKNPTETEPKPSGLLNENPTRTENEPNSKTSQSQNKDNPPSPTGKAPPCPDGVDSQVWADWLQLRKAKKAAVTGTVIDGAQAEAAKAGMTLDAFLRVWCLRGTQGLQAEWLKPHERPAVNGNHAEPAWRTEQRERMQAFAGPAAAKRPATATAIDMEETDAASRLVG
jgi:uncharacterized protein YdaU (DUF1376 family)